MTTVKPSSKSVRRIVILGPDGPQVIFRKKQGKKKGTRGLRDIGKVTRRLVKSQGKMADDYLGRHRKSDSKKRDGWVRDFSVNSLKATRKAARRLSPDKLFRL